MIFVDTESQGEQQTPTLTHHKLWFGWACSIRIRTDRGVKYDRKLWKRFTTAAEFWHWVDSLTLDKTRMWVFAHNWNFDAGILNVSKILPSLGWGLRTYINDKPPFILTFRHSTRTLRLIDTLNYFAGSLESIGESIGIAKLPFPNDRDPQEVWDIYCKRDIEVLIMAVLSFRTFVQDHDLGTFQSTLASQAFNAFRHRFMDHKILISGDEKANQLERESYHGGRTEAFFLGERREKLYYLDVNSMYPAVMRQHEFPARLQKSRHKMTVNKAVEYRQQGAVTVECIVNVTEPVYPKRIDHRLCFPIGRFSTTLCTPEFDYAVAHNHIESITRLLVYDVEPLFSRYIDFFYAQRSTYKTAGNDTFQYLCKILLNSFYGKFGQNGQKWEDTQEDRDGFTGIIYEQETPDSPVRRLRYRMGVIQEFKREGESSNSFPAIAAHVTAYGRMLLWSLIKQAGRENVYYVDTDSLIVNEDGYRNLLEQLDASLLGALKVEATSDSATIWGAKDYIFGDVAKHKGIKKKARQLAPDRWEQERFVSWDYLLSQGYDGYIPIETIQKTLHRVYRKGTPTGSGWVKPLEVWEDG